MNGVDVYALVGVFELFWCGMVGGFFFPLGMNGRVGTVSHLGAVLGFAYSRISGVLCVWWRCGIVLHPLGRLSDCMNSHRA